MNTFLVSANGDPPLRIRAATAHEAVCKANANRSAYQRAPGVFITDAGNVFSVEQIGPRDCRGHEFVVSADCDLVDVCIHCGEERA